MKTINFPLRGVTIILVFFFACHFIGTANIRNTSTSMCFDSKNSISCSSTDQLALIKYPIPPMHMDGQNNQLALIKYPIPPMHMDGKNDQLALIKYPIPPMHMDGQNNQLALIKYPIPPMHMENTSLA